MPSSNARWSNGCSGSPEPSKALGRALSAHGVMDMSDQWIQGVATRIRAGESVDLPTFDELS